MKGKTKNLLKDFVGEYIIYLIPREKDVSNTISIDWEKI